MAGGFCFAGYLFGNLEDRLCNALPVSTRLAASVCEAALRRFSNDGVVALLLGTGRSTITSGTRRQLDVYHGWFLLS